MQLRKSYVNAVCFSLLTTQAFAAVEQTCPERLDRQERLTLALAKENDSLQVNAGLYAAQKKLYIDNETLLKVINKSSEELTGKYKSMWEDAEKRAERHWYENAGFLILTGVAMSLVLVAGSVAVYGALRK